MFAYPIVWEVKMNIKSISEVHYDEHFDVIDVGGTSPDNALFSILVVEEEVEGEVVKHYQTTIRTKSTGITIYKADSYEHALTICKEVYAGTIEGKKIEEADNIIKEAIDKIIGKDKLK